MKFNVKDFLRKYTMVIALVVVFILFCGLTDGRLLYAQNMSNLMLKNGYVLVLACGMLLCILTGGNIDLSVGAVICMVGGLAAVMIGNKGMNPYLTIIICLVVGLLVGVWQGYWIGYKRIPPFITTLAGMFIFRGFGRLILDNKTVSIQDKGFLNVFTSYINIPGLDDTANYSALIVGIVVAVYVIFNVVRSRANKAKRGYRQNTAFSDYSKAVIIAAVILWYCYKLFQYKGISIMFVWVVAICLIYNFITSRTAFGRYFYAIGGNEKATQLSGIDTNKVYFIAYANMGLLAGLAGLLCAARVGSVNGSTGTSFEMDAIGSCFIGGASAYGGSGTVGGVVIGALLLGVINMGLEGIMVMGALGGALMMKYLPDSAPAPVVILLVVLASVLVGMIFSLLLGVAAIHFNADQTLVGTALNLLGPAAAVVIVRAINMAENPDNVSSTVAYKVAKKAFLIRIGKFEFSWFMLFALLILLASYVVLYKTRFGLRLMACGEHPQAADSVGINVFKMRYAGVLISGALGGLGGLVYITAGVSEWKFENGVAGFGFLALAVMIFGQWKPVNIGLAALLFGLFRALSNVYTGFDALVALKLPSTLYNMFPYIISLIVLVFVSKNSRAPKAEGIPYDKGQR